MPARRAKVAKVELRPDQVETLTNEYRAYSFCVLLAADDEERLARLAIGPNAGIEVVHKTGFQETQFPCERLFGGDWQTLSAAVEAGAFDGRDDEVEWLERLFFIRESEGELDHSHSPEDLLALEHELLGRWWAIVADGPWDAYVHVRDHQQVDIEYDATCPECFVEVRGVVPDQSSARRLCPSSPRPEPVVSVSGGSVER